ncbi:M48 family metallopeptidase [Streptomyces meridianus]|uniref:M48 family metalloprotease n=1 Tax=Streptomyces meridianus TaxID=2938945 RepID=A0ABT0X1K5_9ACTN|nr:M48 family metallopeptidase [Streptomyces meridianus]MCM2576035.1 M48 family metalloprotease [Streptomyces meridianus]
MDDNGRKSGPRQARRRFPGISSRAYEHPADRSALVALRRLSGFDTVFRALSALLPERSLKLLLLSDSVRAGERQFPLLDAALRDACYVLDLEKVPPLFVAQDPRPEAMCIGLDEPVIVVTTGLVGLLDEREMRTALGHEVGHALSGHAVYRTILLFVTNLAPKVAWIPLGNVALMSVVTALREWFRKSELSADRAGLLVGQDLQVSVRTLMKLAGGSHLHEMNVDAFLEQADEYAAGGDLRDSVLKVMNLLPRSHPFTTVRAAELRRWAEGDEHRRIMDGRYPRREDDKDASLGDSMRESASHYRDAVRSGTDPLSGLIRDIADGAGELGGRLRDVFTGRPDRDGGPGAGRADTDGTGRDRDTGPHGGDRRGDGPPDGTRPPEGGE